MRSFRQILEESKEIYEFRIKVAGEFDNEKLNKLESALQKFSLGSITKPKRTPIQEHPQDFPPSVVNKEVHIIDVEFEYPSTPAELQTLVSDALCVSEGNVIVMDRHSHVEADREAHIEKTKKPEKYKTLLTSEYEKTPGKPPYGDEYNKKMLKQYKTTKFKIAGEAQENSSPFMDEDKSGKTSPVGSTK